MIPCVVNARFSQGPAHTECQLTDLLGSVDVGLEDICFLTASPAPSAEKF